MALIFNDIVSDCSKHTIINVSTSFEIHDERKIKYLGCRVIIIIECIVPEFTNIYKDIKGEALDMQAMREQYKERELAFELLDKISTATLNSKLCTSKVTVAESSNGEKKYTFKLYI